MSAFIALREKHLAIFNDIFARHRLNAVVFPQMREQLAAREAKDIIHETTVSEINLAGLPGVTFPAGSYASGWPFNLIAVGPQWSEAELLGIAFAYEQATRHRKPPVLSPA
jgi:aspartyl-tRNA(Asn)/glutamyl-tRNA(Gln) amidotransferase subunit A